jgi:hypothetical protein
MKEATGEMNMTVITIIAIGAIIAFFWAMWPTIQNTIRNTWTDVSNHEANYNVNWNNNGGTTTNPNP